MAMRAGPRRRIRFRRQEPPRSSAEGRRQRSVERALIAHRGLRESRIQQEALVTALQDRTRLAYVRYRGGVDTQLKTRSMRTAICFRRSLPCRKFRLNELVSVVRLYKALGGAGMLVTAVALAAMNGTCNTMTPASPFTLPLSEKQAPGS